MNIPFSLRLVVAAGALGLALQAQAESFASSASSAGSASSGSVSDSLAGSSNSSQDNKRKVADGEYRIIQIAATPDRAGRTRVTMQADDPQQRVVLDLPQATFDKQGLVAGDVMYAHNRVYGIEFGRQDTRQPFYLVLADEWYGELASRPVGI
jgi:type IV secretory pathway TrbL component